MSLFNTTTLTFTRQIETTTTPSGKVVHGGSETITVVGSLQPTNEEQLQSRPELRDFKQVFTVYTTTELRKASASEYEADTTVIAGKEFTVERVEPWKNGIIDHYTVFIAR